MTIFEKNIEKFPHLKEYLPDELPKFPQLDFSGESFLTENHYDQHRAFFVALDILSPKMVTKIVDRINEHSAVVFWYLDATSLQLALESIDFTIFDKNVIILCGHPSNDKHINITREHLSHYAYYMTNIRPILKYSQNADFLRQCREVLHFLHEESVNFIYAIGNDLDDTLLGIHNNIKNFPAMLDSVFFDEFKASVKKYYKGKPAVIVATGPSLNKNIDLLAEYQDKALILACDASMTPMKAHEIKADIVGSVERVLITYEKFYQGKEFDDVIFCGPTIVRNELVEHFPDNRVLAFKTNGSYHDIFSSFLDDKAGNLVGASVAHTMLDIAHQLECDPIILVGQDLAYSKDGTSHVEGSVEKWSIELSGVEDYVEDIDGDMIATTPVWRMFLKFYELMIKEFNINNIIDATEGGAKIKGTKIMTLEEALGNFSDFDKPNLVDVIKNIKLNMVDHSVYQEQSLTVLDEFLAKFAELEEMISQAETMSKKSFDRIDRGINTQAQLDKIYDALDYVAEDIVGKLLDDDHFRLYYNHPLREFYSVVGMIDVSNFSVETIKENLEAQKKFLENISLYNMKMIRTLVEGIEYLVDKFEFDDFDDSQIAKYRHYSNDDDLKIMAE